LNNAAERFWEASLDHPGVELPVLIGQSGPLNGKRWLIESDVIIGRENNCEIVVPDRQVSRHHARISLRDRQGVMLEDLGSKNGTFCNGDQVINPVFLHDGDIVQIAVVQNFVYLSSDATMPMEKIDIQETKTRFGLLYLEVRSRRVWIGQQEVNPPLSAPQFRLLQALYDQNGKVVPRDELIKVVWNSEDAEGVSEQAFDALVRRLRNRLSGIDPRHDYILTVRGHGLRLENPPV